jgi:plasmid stability protein
MGAIIIRNLDDAVVTAIKRRAADNGISMAEEIRRLLAAAHSELFDTDSSLAVSRAAAR